MKSLRRTAHRLDMQTCFSILSTCSIFVALYCGYRYYQHDKNNELQLQSDSIESRPMPINPECRRPIREILAGMFTISKHYFPDDLYIEVQVDIPKCYFFEDFFFLLFQYSNFCNQFLLQIVNSSNEFHFE